MRADIPVCLDVFRCGLEKNFDYSVLCTVQIPVVDFARSKKMESSTKENIFTSSDRIKQINDIDKVRGLIESFIPRRAQLV